MKKRPEKAIVADLPCGVGIKIRAEVEKFLLRQVHAKTAQHLQSKKKQWLECALLMFIVCPCPCMFSCTRCHPEMSSLIVSID